MGFGSKKAGEPLPLPERRVLKACALSDLAVSTTLGTGTFGRVRLCQWSAGADADSGYYALKMLKKSEIIRLKQVDHIKSEIHLLSRIENPFIVNLVAKFQDPKMCYLVIEYINGGELFTHLRKAGRFTNVVGMYYGAEIATALNYLHSMRTVYRDLKPENLLIVGNTGHIKITDFGFAKFIEDRTWTLCGTPEYLAPEIIQNKGHSFGVDWWALGVLIYEMLAGYPPFYDENPFGIYQKILQGTVEYPKHFNKHAKDLIGKLLTANITKRLGCLKNAGADVMKHKYFSSINWDDLNQLKLPKGVKLIVTHVSHAGDTANFDPYPDSPSEPASISGNDAVLFEDFDDL